MSCQPPRFATWLVDMFTPYTQVEAVRGDLLEEFSEQALKEGARSARRWYWRQSVKTIAHLFAAAFRGAPWTMAGAILAGWLTDLGGWSADVQAGFDSLLYGAAGVVLKRYPVYHYVNAHLFWTIYNPFLIHKVIVAMLMGCVAGAIAKERETIAATSLSFLWGILLTMRNLTMGYLWWPPPPPPGIIVMILHGTISYFLLHHVLVISISIVMGGSVARTIRVRQTSASG
jgi:hypothetical protein